jgi:hypothetical protein
VGQRRYSDPEKRATIVFGLPNILWPQDGKIGRRARGKPNWLSVLQLFGALF